MEPLLSDSDATSAQRFREKFMGKPVTPSFSLNISEFSDISVCGHSITQMLSHWKQALSIDEPIYENLVRVTITVGYDHENEYQNVYILLSIDVGSEYQKVIENMVLPFVIQKRGELFSMTRAFSEKYAEAHI